MKFLSAFIVSLMIFGCATDSSDKGKSSDADTGNSTESLAPQVITSPDNQPDITLPTQDQFTPNPNQTNVEADASGKVWHFVCPDQCAGGVGDAKAPCPVCGKELAHNQAYHNNTNAANSATIDAGDNSGTPQVFTPPTPEPAQNAQGVWHYTCPKGCAGGGAASGPCAVCGTTLAHNAAYHN